MTPYEEWKRYHLNDDNIHEMVDLFREDEPFLGGGDTESDGLHVIYSKAFLIVFGWFIPGDQIGRVFTFEPTPKTMEVFRQLSQELRANVWHNTKIDLHFMENAGYPYRMNNLVENMALARCSLEALPARAGGDSLKLKELGEKYVEPSAGESESKLKDLKTKLESERTKELGAALKQFPLVINGEQQYTATGRKKYWGKGAIEKFLKDITNDVKDLPDEVREVWETWQEEYGGQEVTYKDIYEVYPKEMIHYAQNDVITMLEFAKKALPVVKQRNQKSVIRRETKVIYPLARMERVGINTDQEYLEHSRIKMKKYIQKKRFEMYGLIGERVNVNQHAQILRVFKEKWDIHLESADKANLKRVEKKHEGDPKRYAELIRELRTLEKWYSTYIIRIQNITRYDGRFYTQIQQCNAVSGRVGSDGQQFPKDAIKDDKGNELYHPRKAFIPDGGEYDRIYYLDFSQIELRDQANYTLLVSGGDLNLCRAYMPFKCRHYKTGEEYDYNNVEQRNRWNELKPGHPDPSNFKKGLEDVFNLGWSVWITPEGKPWTPTDVHGETTHNALLQLNYNCLKKYERYEKNTECSFYESVMNESPSNIVIDEDIFKKMRSKGKIFNFMKNYGGGLKAAMDQLELSEDVAQALIDGYAEAFPEVVTYQNTVIQAHQKQGYIANMYGRRYYLKDTNSSYKLANYGVQGTCADMLKECIIDVDEYLKDKKTKFQMNVHDELSFLVHRSERHIKTELRKIMEKHDWHLVPIVADIEYTETNWADKIEVKDEAEVA